MLPQELRHRVLELAMVRLAHARGQRFHERSLADRLGVVVLRPASRHSLRRSRWRHISTCGGMSALNFRTFQIKKKWRLRQVFKSIKKGSLRSSCPLAAVFPLDFAIRRTMPCKRHSHGRQVTPRCRLARRPNVTQVPFWITDRRMERSNLFHSGGSCTRSRRGLQDQGRSWQTTTALSVAQTCLLYVS